VFVGVGLRVGVQEANGVNDGKRVIVGRGVATTGLAAGTVGVTEAAGFGARYARANPAQ
jgi:hypothetical protein